MIEFTQGDELPITLICRGQDLTGATITVIFLGKINHDVIIPDAQMTIDADQVTNKGKFVCGLLATDSAKVADGEGLNIIVKVVQSGVTRHYHGRGILTVRKGTLVS